MGMENINQMFHKKHIRVYLPHAILFPNWYAAHSLIITQCQVKSCLLTKDRQSSEINLILQKCFDSQ